MTAVPHILPDTSIWIDHFRQSDPILLALHSTDAIVMHHMVIGELACGNFRDRAQNLADLYALPSAMHAQDDEVISMIEGKALFGCGVGFVDMHLLASCLIAEDRLWTRDKKLMALAKKLGVLWETN